MRLKWRRTNTTIFDVLLLTCVFEKISKVWFIEFGIKPLYCVSISGYTWQCSLKHTGIDLQTLQDKDLILILKNIIRGGMSSVMGDRYVKSDDNNRILYQEATNIYGHFMIQLLPYDESEMWHGHPDLYMNELEEILNTPEDSDIGCSIEVDLRYPYNIKEKTKNFPFRPEIKIVPEDKYNDYMKTIKRKSYTKAKKLKCDWTDKKNYLIFHGMINFYVRHGMVVDKIHEIISFKQSKWLEKYIYFITQKRNKTKKKFEKGF